MTDLAADPLDLVELMFLLEQEFGIRLTREDLSLSAQLSLPDEELRTGEVLTPLGCHGRHFADHLRLRSEGGRGSEVVSQGGQLSCRSTRALHPTRRLVRKPWVSAAWATAAPGLKIPVSVVRFRPQAHQLVRHPGPSGLQGPLGLSVFGARDLLFLERRSRSIRFELPRSLPSVHALQHARVPVTHHRGDELSGYGHLHQPVGEGPAEVIRAARGDSTPC
jgi:hypothetical protein